MEHVTTHPNTDILRQLTPLQDMAKEQIELLARSVEIEEARRGTKLLERGNQDDFSFFLIEGTIELTAADGKVSSMDGDHPSAKSPIAQLLPRRYDAVAKTTVRFLRIDNHLLEDLATLPTHMASAAPAGFVVDAELGGENDLENQITLGFLQDLEKDELVLPSLPDVAVRIGKAIKNENLDAEDIAAIIQTDPSITAKLIRSANSAFYGMPTPVETCSSAIVRLGLDITHKLVLTYAMRELFNTRSALLRQRMSDLWKHSTKVAAVCFVLARHDIRFDQEHAMLVGLLHDIGVVAILKYAENYPDEVGRPGVLDATIKRLRGQIGSLILRKWGFAEDFVITALESENWFRNKGLKPDYCDLVLIAQLHSFIGTAEAVTAPSIGEIPAHKKLSLGELTPRKSLKILDEAGTQIALAEHLLRI
jgi:HD-like signal output (HDOD) protein